MKHFILMIALSSIWGCSGDPGQQASRDRNPGQADIQQAGDASSGNSITGESGNTAADTSGNEVKSDVVEAAKTEIPPVATGPTEEEEGSVTPPHKVTGAYLVGTILPGVEGEPIRIGLVIKAGDKRLSLEPERYEANWSLASVLENPDQVKLSKSSDEEFDRVLEFNGTEEEFIALQESISVQVSVSEGEGDSKLHEVVMNSLFELLAP
ncbi:MAG: hypothetical protein EOP07_10625 [Proteobacteria bacterium]|nr:MAG: hypothetical protein EOP07_10625 [Pseudomonadota bacterium]